MKKYCTQNNGKCNTCSLVNYGKDCCNNSISARPTENKWSRVMQEYNGHKGQATIKHVERNIKSAYPTAYSELTGIQYGKVMSVANVSFQDGKNIARENGEIWDYYTPTDWVAGIGSQEPDGCGGYRNHTIKVDGETITITLMTGETKKYKLVI